MHRTQPLRCVCVCVCGGAPGDPARDLAARTHECILHLLQRVRSQRRPVAAAAATVIAGVCAPVRVYTWRRTWLEEQSSRGGRTIHEVRLRGGGGGARRRMVGSWTEAKVCEEVGGKVVGSCLLLRGVLKGEKGGRRTGGGGEGTRGPRKPDGGDGEGALPCESARCDDDDDGGSGGGDGGGDGGGKRREGREKTRRRRGEGRAPAQRGPVPHCMANLETRSPQGETRGPKRRPRARIGRNSRESRLLVRMLVIARAHETVLPVLLLRPSTIFPLSLFCPLSLSFSLFFPSHVDLDL